MPGCAKHILDHLVQNNIEYTDQTLNRAAFLSLFLSLSKKSAFSARIRFSCDHRVLTPRQIISRLKVLICMYFQTIFHRHTDKLVRAKKSLRVTAHNCVSLSQEGHPLASVCHFTRCILPSTSHFYLIKKNTTAEAKCKAQCDLQNHSQNDDIESEKCEKRERLRVRR